MDICYLAFLLEGQAGFSLLGTSRQGKGGNRVEEEEEGREAAV